MLGLLWLLCGLCLPAQVAAESAYIFEECAQATRRSLRDELNRIAQQAAQIGDFDLGVVERHWVALDIDRQLENEVALAVTAVHAEAGFVERFRSGWSADKARELTRRVAERVLSSQGTRTAMEQLAQALSAEVAAAMELVTARSASATLSCMQAFIGSRYTTGIAGLFQVELSPQLTQAGLRALQQQNPDLVAMHTASLVGVGTMVTTKVASRLAARLRGRVAGRIMARVLGRAGSSLIPAVGWLVGFGLIGLDLWEGADGALPQIERSLTSPATMAELRGKVVEATLQSVRSELPVVARQVAEDTYGSWQHMQTRLRGLLELAERSPDFRQVLRETPADRLQALADALTQLRAALGPERFARALDDDSFARLLGLPSSALTLLLETRSFMVTFAWAEMAGPKLDALVALQVFRVRTPEDLDQSTLHALLGLPSADLVAKLLRLDDADLKYLLRLPTADLAVLVERHDPETLRWLVDYLVNIHTERARQVLLERVLADPDILRKLKNECIRRVLSTTEDMEGMLAFVSDDWAQQTWGALGGLLHGSAQPSRLLWCRL